MGPLYLYTLLSKTTINWRSKLIVCRHLKNPLQVSRGSYPAAVLLDLSSPAHLVNLGNNGEHCSVHGGRQQHRDRGDCQLHVRPHHRLQPTQDIRVSCLPRCMYRLCSAVLT